MLGKKDENFLSLYIQLLTNPTKLMASQQVFSRKHSRKRKVTPRLRFGAVEWKFFFMWSVNPVGDACLAHWPSRFPHHAFQSPVRPDSRHHFSRVACSPGRAQDCPPLQLVMNNKLIWEVQVSGLRIKDWHKKSPPASSDGNLAKGRSPSHFTSDIFPSQKLI